MVGVLALAATDSAALDSAGRGRGVLLRLAMVNMNGEDFPSAMVLQFSLYKLLFVEFSPYLISFPSPKDTSKERKTMAPNKSSPLAGILITAFFGTISIIIAAITMYQVHSIWVKYHDHRRENKAAAGTLLLSPYLSNNNR